MEFPSELLYSQDHEWVRIEGTTAIVGITEFAQGELGDIVFVDIPTRGQLLEAGAVFGSVEAVKTVSDLFMPLAGEVLEINPALESTPEVVNSDPYGQGWMVKIKLSPASDIQSLLKADAYRAMVQA